MYVFLYYIYIQIYYNDIKYNVIYNIPSLMPVDISKL